MFHISLPQDEKRGEHQGQGNPWHGEQARDGRVEEVRREGNDAARPSVEGSWGERDTAIPSCQDAMTEFDAMRRNLSSLTQTKSNRSTRSHTDRVNPLSRLSTNRSAHATITPQISRTEAVPEQTPAREEVALDLEAGEKEDEGITDEDEDEEKFELDQFMKEGHFEKRAEGRSTKRVGVTWKNLTVLGRGSTATFVKTLPDAIIGTFGPDLYKIITRVIPSLALSKHKQTRKLVDDFTGVVKDGEMMLVLGKPGSGCSTFLKAISNNRAGYADVQGEVHYGGIAADKQKKRFRGEVNYMGEDDVHFANLNVWQTLNFALLNKTKKREKGEVKIIANALMRMFGIAHTKYTPVGDEYVRGVSGGERKRVSIAETLASKSTVVCWDNSTRGLDASTALDYAKSLRIMTDVSNRTTLVTLYQAGEGIYEQMDKVLVIHDGKCVFLGRANEAKQYFIDLGFHCPDRQTTPDFLTACTDPMERRFRDGYEHKAPRTAADLEKAYRSSELYRRNVAEVDAYESELKETDYADTRDFEQAVREQKSNRTVSKKSSYTVSFPRQVMACTKREFWLILGDRETLYTKFFIIISNALIVGSLFYGQSLGSTGAFSRGGALFFSILFLGWLQLSELMKAVSGRAVVARHQEYAFYRPSAVSAARVIADFPMLLSQVVVFCIIMYFMTGLDVDVSKFWIYMLFVYTTCICITSMYRMFAALSPTIDDAVRFSATSLNLLLIYTGYVIPKPQLLSQYIWFGWIYYVNPVSYSFEAVLANEFHARDVVCDPMQLVPQGPNADPAFQGCALTGSAPNTPTTSGSDYIGTSFDYSRSNLWRNFAVIIAFTILYLLVTIIAVETFNFAVSSGGALMFKKSKQSKKAIKESVPADEEKVEAELSADKASRQTSDDSQDESEALEGITKSESIFTWQDVEYTVPYRGGERKLLNNVSGYVKPGSMIALMGASGAGKTTLLNSLAQRQSMGVVKGDMLVDGKALDRAFQRGTGFCEQMDLHDGTATIREALEFSAILRQDAKTSRADKIAYVDTVIDLLELNDVQDAIINSLGVEQRKRVTIGVELAAKPSLLLFLDEPTSGLDSQSAYSIVRFLKKLSNAGQAIICTIHQPSSILIQQFDMILALNPGGNVFYFGPVGDNGQDVIKYFGERGAQCPPNKNVAEFILEVAAKGGKNESGKRIDWNNEWRASPNAKQVIKDIETIKTERSSGTTTSNDKDIKAFAAPVTLQTIELTKRVFRQHWRDPSYYYGKLFVSVVIGIFNGFTFWQLGNSVTDMQNRMFTAFLIIVFPPSIVNSVVPKFFQNMALWQTREYPSRIYGWFAFVTAQVVTEIPIAIVSAVIYWLLWYWPAGLPADPSVSGYVFLMTMLFFLFQASWGQWICAFAPSFTVISNVLPFFFVMFSLFNGVIRPYSMIPVFWRYWMYYVNPSTYWLAGVLAATLHNQPVQCQPQETARFDAPPGQTCAQYAGAFADSAPGYLLNPDATADCQYCPYSVGDDYLSSLNIQYADKWPSFGIFLAFCISNWALVYFFIWSVRVKGWSFGFGAVSRVLTKAFASVTNLFKSEETKRREREEAEKETVGVD